MKKNTKTILAVLVVVALAIYVFKPRLLQGFQSKGPPPPGFNVTYRPPTGKRSGEPCGKNSDCMNDTCIKIRTGPLRGQKRCA